MRVVLFVVLPLLFLGLGALAALTLGSERPAYGGGGGGAVVVSSAKVATISHGQDVDLARHAIPNARTVFEYTSDW